MRAQSSCTSPADVPIRIQEENGKRLCGEGTFPESTDDYRVATVNPVFASGKDITIQATVSASCTLWIDRIWTEPIG